MNLVTQPQYDFSETLHTPVDFMCANRLKRTSPIFQSICGSVVLENKCGGYIKCTAHFGNVLAK